jgi:hypothetical protein
MKFMRNRRAFLFLILVTFVFPSSVFSLDPPTPGSAEDLFWAPPATVHDYKKPSDLHNVVTSVLALTELEFLRLLDALINLPLRTGTRPLSNLVDGLDHSYHRIPQIRPVYRIAQLFDALQIRQLSLSDARFFAVAVNGGGGTGVTPIMQTRIHKLLVLIEDIVNDVDELVMFPINKTASHIKEKKVRIKTVGYAADGLGVGRRVIFIGLRKFNRWVVTLGNKLIHGIEKPHNAIVRHKRSKKNSDTLIYARMPYWIYLAREDFFRAQTKRAFAGSLEDWQLGNREIPIVQDGALLRRSNLPKPTLKPDDSIFVAMEAKGWKKSPELLQKYVIDLDEFESFINGPVIRGTQATVYSQGVLA